MGNWWMEDEYGEIVVPNASGSFLVMLEEVGEKERLPTLLRLVRTGNVGAKDIPKLIKECRKASKKNVRELAKFLAKIPPDSGVLITDYVEPGDEAL